MQWFVRVIFARRPCSARRSARFRRRTRANMEEDESLRSLSCSNPFYINPGAKKLSLLEVFTDFILPEVRHYGGGGQQHESSRNTLQILRKCSILRREASKQQSCMRIVLICIFNHFYKCIASKTGSRGRKKKRKLGLKKKNWGKRRFLCPVGEKFRIKQKHEQMVCCEERRDQMLQFDVGLACLAYPLAGQQQEQESPLTHKMFRMKKNIFSRAFLPSARYKKRKF